MHPSLARRAPRRRLAVVAALFGAVEATACLDVSSPVTGIASISTILSPFPSVVRGDSLRDSTGKADSLRVVAFAPNGDTVRDAVVRFYSRDSTNDLRVDSTTGIVTAGDSLLSATIVAVVRPASGKGQLQAQLILPIVPKPDTVHATTNPTDFPFNALASADSMASGLRSPLLEVLVSTAAGVPVPSYLVSYEITDPVRSRDANPAAVLVDPASGKETRIDTTDASGKASRQLRLRLRSIDASVLTGTDTTVVRAHVKYHGAEIAGSPVVFTLLVHQ